jgi:hypothetical protein
MPLEQYQNLITAILSPRLPLGLPLAAPHRAEKVAQPVASPTAFGTSDTQIVGINTHVLN